MLATSTLALLHVAIAPVPARSAKRPAVRQKISSCFRSMTGVDRFCQIRSYVRTLRKQVRPILAS